MNVEPPGLLFIVAAPSGAGKTSLCKALLQRLSEEGQKELRWSCSYTTRKPRAGEVHGVDYFFVDDAAFDRMVGEDGFAEWAHVHGKRYGTGRSYLEEAAAQGIDLLVEIDIQGARSLKARRPDAVFVFILPPDWPTLEGRLRGRGTEAEAEVRRRLETAKGEILEWTWFDYIIVNDDFAGSVDHLRALVLAERSRRGSMGPAVKKVIDSIGSGSKAGAE
jgi:guanylate kinase